MRVYQKLKFTHEGDTKEILFGIPETEEEFAKMYSLRFDVYSKKDYFKEGLDIVTDQDTLDKEGKCLYVIALVDDGRILGAVRLIRDTILPTEKYFDFETPLEIERVPSDNRAEIGRLVVQQYSETSFFPRNLVLLFLLKTLLQVGHEVGVVGGYSFVKKTLLDKLAKLNVPIRLIQGFKQRYPSDGALYNYFNQEGNPVFPTYFLTSEAELYFESLLGSSSRLIVRGDKAGEFVLNDSLYTKFLKRMKVL